MGPVGPGVHIQVLLRPRPRPSPTTYTKTGGNISFQNAGGLLDRFFFSLRTKDVTEATCTSVTWVNSGPLTICGPLKDLQIFFCSVFSNKTSNTTDFQTHIFVKEALVSFSVHFKLTHLMLCSSLMRWVTVTIHPSAPALNHLLDFRPRCNPPLLYHNTGSGSSQSNVPASLPRSQSGGRSEEFESFREALSAESGGEKKLASRTESQLCQKPR